jgi:hypothetical protein
MGSCGRETPHRKQLPRPTQPRTGFRPRGPAKTPEARQPTRPRTEARSHTGPSRCATTALLRLRLHKNPQRSAALMVWTRNDHVAVSVVVASPHERNRSEGAVHTSCFRRPARPKSRRMLCHIVCSVTEPAFGAFAQADQTSANDEMPVPAPQPEFGAAAGARRLSGPATGPHSGDAGSPGHVMRESVAEDLVAGG